MTLPERGRSRVIITGVSPQVDDGRYPIKRVQGDVVRVEANIFTDGHDRISGVLQYREVGEDAWQETPLIATYNDRWHAEFSVEKLTRYEYSVLAWIDHFETWFQDLQKRVAAGQNVKVDLQIGAGYVEETAKRVSGADGEQLTEWAKRLTSSEAAQNPQPICEDTELEALMLKHSERRFATRYERSLEVKVDRKRAEFSTWYEFFPRSTGPAGQHGNFLTAADRLPYVASMGFDVVYLPPIHPIGDKFRKGRNNSVTAESGDVGSPWAIGSKDGGHKSIHPELGSMSDFQRFVGMANDLGIEVALDVAFQCSPDHPYVKEHPDWFKSRPDGTIQYAENPPKKYQDIYPFHFECDDWRNLWTELKSIFLFWIERGVRIFRVDNPHTKPLPFWQWCITEIHKEHPDIIFLAEAFTRPRIMEQLAKFGFNQSYTYFAWRDTKADLTEYMTELTQTDVYEYFRPNFWPNTPDILTEYLQTGGKSAFQARVTLAATLTANYGIYGPAFELQHSTPAKPGSEEYLDSEKYQIRHDDLNHPGSLREFIGRLSAIRNEHACLQSNKNLEFHTVDNDHLIAYTKRTDDGSELLLTVVNLDPRYKQSGFVQLPLEDLRIDPTRPFQVHDLLSGSRYMWQGSWNYVELNPHITSAHVFRVRPDVHSETDPHFYS